MEAILSYLREFHLASVALRLALALLAGAAIGYGRARKKVNAGLRTYILVSLGAALTVLISTYEYHMLTGSWAWAAALTDMKFDASRFAAQVISGIGFLAAGTIIGIAHQQVSGLTTAIGLFTAAAMGLAAGAGFYEGVLLAVLFIIITLEAMKPVENGFKRHIRNITICVKFGQIEDMASIMGEIRSQNATVYETEIERTEFEGDEPPTAILSIKMSKQQASHSALLSSVAELPCVFSVQELIY